MRKRGQLEKQIKRYLQEMPVARERSNRYRALRHFVIKIYPELELVNKDVFISAIDTAIATDRYIRKIQAEDKSLRGSDYGDKEVLEQEAQIELGYEGGGNDILDLNEKD